MNKPRIHVLALGGTIAMVSGDAGVKPGLGADDLIAAVPGIDELAVLEAETVSKLGSFDLTVDSMLQVAERITELANSGSAEGVIVTQGTDTIEETSFLLDCVLRVDIPVVVIGAMRNPLQMSPDGSGNLLAATRVVTDDYVRDNARALGVLSVMLDQIHAAAEVGKMDSHRVDAFASPQTGALGVLVEDRVRLAMTPRRDWKTAIDATLANKSIAELRANPKSVALAFLAMNETGGMLDAVSRDPNALGYDGMVLGTLGGGHAPAVLTDTISALTARMPVAMAPRMGSGLLLHKTYEIVGAEMDMAQRGVISAGRLHPFKTRMLMTLMLMAGLGADEIRGVLSHWN